MTDENTKEITGFETIEVYSNGNGDIVIQQHRDYQIQEWRETVIVPIDHLKQLIKLMLDEAADYSAQEENG